MENSETEPVLSKKLLEYKFTDEEINHLAKQLAYENNNLDQSKSQKKAVVSQFDNKIKQSESSIMSLSSKISNGSEWREMACEVKMNYPQVGIKTITRPDTDYSWEEAMTDKEMQEKLFHEN